MYDLTNAQRTIDNKLKDAEKNLIMYGHLGTGAIPWLEHSPAMGQIWTMPHNKFYNAILTMFKQLTLQPIACYQFWTCKQHRDKSILEFLSPL
uniref:Uncharacterized protein n=1 Tax=Romanomermis culicivorax TaxID=13658 RepID=A0A915KFM9_ROMCU